MKIKTFKINFFIKSLALVDFECIFVLLIDLNITQKQKGREIMSTEEKIKSGVIRIEKGRLVGLGNGDRETIDITELDELMGDMEAKEIADSFSDLVQRLGSLGLYLYKCGDSIPDERGTLISTVPNEDDLYHLHLVSKLFRA